MAHFFLKKQHYSYLVVGQGFTASAPDAQSKHFQRFSNRFNLEKGMFDTIKEKVNYTV